MGPASVRNFRHGGHGSGNVRRVLANGYQRLERARLLERSRHERWQKARPGGPLHQPVFRGLRGRRQSGFAAAGKPVGPGLLLEKLLDGSGHVVGTLICGDNYFVENEELARRLLFDLLKPFDADVLVAGPAFNSGRYGTACASLCLSAQRELNMPAVTGMARSNPGVDICRSEVLIVPTGITAVAMRDAMPGIARLAARVGQGRELGSASDEGYLPRGERRNVDTGLPASERAVDLL
ncbi:MAG: hypothetical protein DMG59_22150, partial [Acidobacteria bacterium]